MPERAPLATAGLRDLERVRSVARCFDGPDGWTFLVGRSAQDNDLLTTAICEPHDFWLHLADGPGAHVIVRNPQKAAALPREIELLAAGLAARFSKANRAGWVTVHLAQGRDVQKRQGQPPGEVTLRRYRNVRVRPLDDAAFSQLREWTRGSSSGAGP